MTRLLLPLLVALLILLPAAAGATDPCAPCGPVQVVKDVKTAAGTGATAKSTYALPAGTLTAADLEQAFTEVQAGGKGIMGFFGLLSDGQKRALPGAVVREMFAKYGVSLEFLPVDALRDVVAESGKVTFRFDFGGESTREVKLPDSTRKVLDIRNKQDPFAADGKNRVKEEKSGGKSLRLRSELQFTVGPEGLTGVREGDLAVHHWLLGWVDIQVHSERSPGKVAVGDKDRPVLQTDGRGEPIVVSGHYQPQRYDDWAIIEAKGQRIEAGIPGLKK